MATLQGPADFPTVKILEQLCVCVRKAVDFEELHEAWDMAPPDQKPDYRDVRASHEEAVGEIGNLHDLLRSSTDAYTRSMQRITQTEAKRHRAVSRIPRRD